MWTFLLAVLSLFRSQPVPRAADDHSAVESAWKIHAALVEWTGKVDQKASFALAVESAVVAAIITLSMDDRALATLESEALWFYRVGSISLVVAIVYAMRAVTPQLRRSKLGGEWRNNFIFFGHLRRWSEPELTKALKGKDLLPMLSQQLIKMSDIAWKKHLYLQRSLILTGLGAILFVVAGMHDQGMFKRFLEWLQSLG